MAAVLVLVVLASLLHSTFAQDCNCMFFLYNVISHFLPNNYIVAVISRTWLYHRMTLQLLKAPTLHWIAMFHCYSHTVLNVSQRTASHSVGHNMHLSANSVDQTTVLSALPGLTTLPPYTTAWILNHMETHIPVTPSLAIWHQLHVVSGASLYNCSGYITKSNTVHSNTINLHVQR